MMTDLFVIKNALELRIDKYLLIDAMTENFLAVYEHFKFLDFSRYSCYVAKFLLKNICELHYSA